MTELERWDDFISNWRSVCKTVVYKSSTADGQDKTKEMATRKVPKLPIEIDGVRLPSLSDSGASPSVLVPAALIPDIYRGRLQHVLDKIQPVLDSKIRQAEGSPLLIAGWLMADVKMCGQTIRTPIYICPNMSKADGIIV
ncbi:MAG: hypothetical protein GY739_13805, partial [Mesoflavibacter sp.]|nr:hypothetical protein [Mesoflavibacter sp.]